MRVEITYHTEHDLEFRTFLPEPIKLGDANTNCRCDEPGICIFPMFRAAVHVADTREAAAYLVRAMQNPDPEKVAALARWLTRRRPEKWTPVWLASIAYARTILTAKETPAA